MISRTGLRHRNTVIGSNGKTIEANNFKRAIDIKQVGEYNRENDKAANTIALKLEQISSEETSIMKSKWKSRDCHTQKILIFSLSRLLIPSLNCRKLKKCRKGILWDIRN